MLGRVNKNITVRAVGVREQVYRLGRVGVVTRSADVALLSEGRVQDYVRCQYSDNLSRRFQSRNTYSRAGADGKAHATSSQQHIRSHPIRSRSPATVPPRDLVKRR